MKLYFLCTRILQIILQFLNRKTPSNHKNHLRSNFPEQEQHHDGGNRCLILASLRFLRSVLSVKDEFYHRFIAQNNLFQNVFDAWRSNPIGDNLVSSSIIEMCDFIRKENIVTLLDHIVNKHLINIDVVAKKRRRRTDEICDLDDNDVNGSNKENEEDGHDDASTVSPLVPTLEDVATPYVNTLTLLRKRHNENILEKHKQSMVQQHEKSNNILSSSSTSVMAELYHHQTHARSRRHQQQQHRQTPPLSRKAAEDQRKFRESGDEENYFNDEEEEEDIFPLDLPNSINLPNDSPQINEDYCTPSRDPPHERVEASTREENIAENDHRGREVAQTIDENIILNGDDRRDIRPVIFSREELPANGTKMTPGSNNAANDFCFDSLCEEEDGHKDECTTGSRETNDMEPPATTLE